MVKNRVSYAWLIPAAILFPLLQIAIFYTRFSNVSKEAMMSSLIFIPIGVVGAGLLIFLLNKEISEKRKRFTIIGFIIAVPVSIGCSLFSGLLLAGIGTIIAGVLPLIIGTYMGYYLGR